MYDLTLPMCQECFEMHRVLNCNDSDPCPDTEADCDM